MEILFYIKGIIIGFAMAVPIGPIGILCIRKTLAEGRARGLIIGLGAATADMLYACVAAFGLTVISQALVSQRIWMRLTGGALLLILGVRTFRAIPVNPKFQIRGSGMLGSYLSTVFLTLSNPLTIFAYIAVFALFGLGTGIGFLPDTALVAGVFSGSALWFLSLSSGATFFRAKLDETGMSRVNRVAGVLIVFSGVAAIASVL
jgi:threonine/homoserine/homoserine lactone efflux protein